MLFALRHGQRILTDIPQLETGNARTRDDAVPLAVAAGTRKTSGLEAAAPAPAASFGYFFPEAAGDNRPGQAEAITRLAASMIDRAVEDGGEDGSGNAPIAPIFTYLGQFIDHDVTANTDRTVTAPDGTPLSIVTGPSIDPLPRDAVTGGIVNLRKGSLQLDSLYGDGPVETPFTQKVKRAMRDPDDPARMRIGTIQVIPLGEVIPVPAGGKGDLPRLGDVLADPNSGLTEADIDALDTELKAVFKKDGVVNAWNAVIGDGRNDENLIVAQLHLAFLHFHNAVADGLKATIPDAEDRFREARKRTTWMYQWLVVNAFLPAVCDPSVVASVKAGGAALYKAFRDRVAPTGPELPLPLEFSVAAFRFGHSMVRGAYDHNRNFGRPARADANSGASFRELFSFTGGDKLGLTITGSTFTRLVSNWPIEWDRFTSATPAFPDRLARKIDTHLAHPLSILLKEGNSEAEPMKSILKQLADRNMRRGYRLNIPTGQAVVAALNAFDAGQQTGGKGGYYASAAPIQALTATELASGTGSALATEGFADATPLWYYVLKEAEVRAGGNHLGPLGSRLVCETLIGLIIQDPESYWHAASPGTWTPAATPVGGKVVSDMSSMLASAGLLPVPVPA